MVDEIQGELHQEARTQGYAPPPERLAELRRVETDAGKKVRAWLDEHRAGEPEPLNGYELRLMGAPEDVLEANREQMRAVLELEHAEQRAIPNVPWKDSWEELMARRLVRYAAEHGFERIALTPGSVHTGRWGTEQIAWESREGGALKPQDIEVTEDGGRWIAHTEDGRSRSYPKPSDHPDADDALAFREQAARDLGNERVVRVAAIGQRGGNAGGVDIEQEAARRNLIKNEATEIARKGQLHELLSKIGKENLTDKLWDRMQKEDSGVSRPRAEGFEQAYDKRIKGAFDKALKKYGAKMESDVVSPLKPGDADTLKAALDATMDKLSAALDAREKFQEQVMAREPGLNFFEIATKEERNEFQRLNSAVVEAHQEREDLKRRGVDNPQLSAHVIDLPEAARQKVLAEGMPLFQRGVVDLGGGLSATLNEDERGAISIGLPDKGGRSFEIRLSKPDPSTLAHETFHMLAEVMGDVAQAGKDPQLKADYDALLGFMGYESHDQRQNGRDAAKEERASHAWEQYLAEGKAPVPELQTVFDRFKTWLTAIYKGLQGIAAQYKSVFGKDMPALTDEMRGVFGRMLGADAEAPPEPQSTPPQKQPPGFAAHQARAKEARDLDSALAAYAAGRIAQMPLGQVRPATYEQQAKVHALKMQELAREVEKGRQGASETRVITPQNRQGEPAHYRLVEANALITSHTPNSFEPEPRYPQNVQERDYSNEVGEQQKVARGGRFLEPSLVLADTPTPVDGPPLVTSGPQALVLGGNARSMMLRRAYDEGGDAAERYKAALREKASVFGITPEQVDAMKQPVLVRAIDDINSESPQQDLVAAVRRFNEGLTQQMSPRIRAVAQARVLTPQTIASIGELLGDGEASIRDLLRDKPQAFMQILERDGVINDTNRAKWVAGDELTAEAKDEIEGMFLGRVMGSGERLQATAPSLANKVERAVPSLLRVAAALPEADEIGDVQGALDLLNEAKRRGIPLDDLLAQQSMFVDEKVPPRTVAMAHLLASKSAKELGQRFKAWADAMPVEEEQSGLFGSEKPKTTPEDALKALFAGVEEDFSGPGRPADGSSLRTTTGGEPPEKATEPILTPQAEKAGKKAKEAQATLSEVQSQHRLSDHLADAARKAKDEQKKVTSYLAERATDDKRALPARADREIDPQGAPVYSDAHDAIMEAFWFRAPSGRPLSVEPAIVRLSADDRLNFDPEALKAILAKPAVRQMQIGEKVKGSLDGLTLDEAKVVQAAIKNIRHAANAAVKVVLEEREAEYVDQVRQIRESAGNRPPPPLPSPSDAGKSGFEKVAHVIKQVDAGMLKPDVILRELGPVGEQYADAMLRSRNRVEEINQRIGGRLQKAIDAMPKEMRRTMFDAVDGPPTKRLNAAKWVRQDLMMLWAWMGTESSTERAAKGLGVTEAQLAKTFDQLTKAEKDFVQASIWDVNDQELKPLLLDQTAKNTGVPMEMIEARPVTTKDGTYRGGFHHASYNAEASKKAAARAVVEMDGVGDYYGDMKSGWAVGPGKGFTKARVENFSDVPNLNWNSVSAHYASVVHYLAVDDFVKALGGLLRRPDAREAIEHAVGREKLQQLDEGLKVFARGSVEAAQGGFQVLNRILGGAFRNRAAVSAFALNPRVLLMQLSHALLASVPLRLGPGSLLYGFTRASLGSIASLAEFSAEHLLHGAGEAFNPYSWSSAREASAKWGTNEIAFRWDRFTDKQRELLSGVGPGAEPGRIYRTLTGGKTAAGETVREGLGKVGHAYDLLNYSMWHVMDGFLSQWLWHARDFKARRAGATPQQAALLADWAVHDAMPPMTLSELSAYARDRGLIGSQLLVKRFPNTMYNLQEIATWQARTGVYDASPGLQRVAAAAGYATNAAATYLAMTFIAHFLGRYLGGHGRRKDEGETVPQWIARQGLSGLFEPLPMGEEISTPFVEKLVNHKEINRDAVMKSFRSMPAVSVIEDEMVDIGDALNQRRPVSDRMFAGTRAIMRAASERTPLQPFSQMRSMYDVLSKKYRPRGPLDAADKMIYGPQRPHRETNPLSDLSRLRGE
jgi:hypothetical protein